MYAQLTTKSHSTDDGVHLRKEGYELMGDTIADTIVEVTKGSKTQGASNLLEFRFE